MDNNNKLPASIYPANRKTIIIDLKLNDFRLLALFTYSI